MFRTRTNNNPFLFTKYRQESETKCVPIGIFTWFKDEFSAPPLTLDTRWLTLKITSLSQVTLHNFRWSADQEREFYGAEVLGTENHYDTTQDPEQHAPFFQGSVSFGRPVYTCWPISSSDFKLNPLMEAEITISTNDLKEDSWGLKFGIGRHHGVVSFIETLPKFNILLTEPYFSEIASKILQAKKPDLEISIEIPSWVQDSWGRELILNPRYYSNETTSGYMPLEFALNEIRFSDSVI